jgi:hypothetical protein
LAAEAVEIVVTVTGLDETISQAVHARTSYLVHEVLWGRRFADVFTQTKDGRLPSTIAGSTTPNLLNRKPKEHQIASTACEARMARRTPLRRG